MEIFDHNTVLKIRSKILEDGFEHYLVGTLAEIAENVGGRTITTDIEFGADIVLELPVVGADRFDDVDIVNSSMVYEALPGLTAYEACRDELWASLSMGYYVQYVRRRWRPSSQQDFDLRRNYRLHYLASGVQPVARQCHRKTVVDAAFCKHRGSRESPRSIASLVFPRQELGRNPFDKTVHCGGPHGSRCDFACVLRKVH